MKNLLEIDKQTAENPVIEVFIDQFLPKLMKLFEEHTKEDEGLIVSRQITFDVLINSIKFLKYSSN